MEIGLIFFTYGPPVRKSGLVFSAFGSPGLVFSAFGSPRPEIGFGLFCLRRSLKNYQYSTEGQKFYENLAPALVISTGSGNK